MSATDGVTERCARCGHGVMLTSLGTSESGGLLMGFVPAHPSGGACQVDGCSCPGYAAPKGAEP